MPRPRTPIGSHGAIKVDEFVGEDDDQLDLPFRARTRYRGPDGRYRQIERWGTSKAGATAALKTAVQEAVLGRAITAAKPADFSSAMTVARLVDLFLADAALDKAPGTVRHYKSVLGAHVAPADRLGSLTLGELSPSLLQAAVDGVKPSGTRQNARRSLSALLAFAVRRGGLDRNPMKSVVARKERAEGSGRDRIAVPLERIPKFLDDVLANSILLAGDTADAVAILTLVGLRSGELCALRWADVDLDAGLLTVASTAIRVAGRKGERSGDRIVRQDGAKTPASNRVVALPVRAVAILRARFSAMREPSSDTMIFPATYGGVRDPDMISKVLKRAAEDLGYPGLTAHGLRRTTATVLNAAGLTARDIADYLGHADTDVTEAHYIQRQAGALRSAQAIDKIVAG